MAFLIAVELIDVKAMRRIRAVRKPEWAVALVATAAAIEDVDYTASGILARVIEHVQQRHVRFAMSDVLGPVRQQLDRYGISKALDPGAYYDTPGEAFEAFHAARAAGS